jgi:CRISPR system Cascade subunit CasC
MNNQINPFLGQRIEFHILQSFPVTCLNRDDVGAPKSAMVGGTSRARVSSQCWKRQVRLSMHELGIKIGMRTKLVSALITKACINFGATPEQASLCGESAASFFGTVENGTNDTLMFITETEANAVAEAYKVIGFTVAKTDKETEKKMSKEEKKEVKASQVQIEKVMKGAVNFAVDGLDVALFGRMVASSPIMNIEAAASFSHAISTHKVSSEVEFFTALDDNKEEQGSAHMGSLEFNSATYYRYVCLDLGQLWVNLAGSNITESVEAFTKALFIAIPSARQTTMSGATPWGYAKITIRKGQRLQVPFEKAIRSENGGILEPSKKALIDYLEKQETLWGSLFGKIGEIEYGDTKGIDDVVGFLKTHVTKVV